MKELKGRISKRDRDMLSRISTTRTLLNLSKNWAIICILIYICNTHFSYLVFVPATMLIAARMHAIIVLSHDAAHYLIARNKKYNDAIAEYCITLPLFASLKRYRTLHFAHHKHLWTDKDPEVLFHRTYEEFQFPLTKGKMFKILLFDTLGVHFAMYTWRKISQKAFWKQSYYSFRLDYFLYYLLLFYVLFHMDLFVCYLQFWIIPYITWYQVIWRIRVISEHNAVPEDVLSGTRTTRANIIDHLFFGPNNANYHAEHHLYPSVPFFNLPKLHTRLMKDAQFVASTHFTKGYINVIRECVI